MDKTKYSENIITLALVKYAGVNPRTYDLLLQRFQALDEILLAEDYELAEIEGISKGAAIRIAKVGKHLEQAVGYSSQLSKRDIRILSRFEESYPSHLMEINDPPPIIYGRGRVLENAGKSIALIGAEEATTEGIALTTQIAKELTTKKVQVLSALEKGNAAAAHLGCKAAGGHSYAVIESGFDQIRGETEIPLAIDIVQTGGIFSEYPPNAVKGKNSFSQSNRLVAGMSQAVVVTEFYEKSIRAHDILEYCHQIGKLSFVLTDPKNGALSDETSLTLAVKRGAIIMSGPNRIDDIIKALV